MLFTIIDQVLQDKFSSIIKSSNKFNEMKLENFDNTKQAILNYFNARETAEAENNHESRIRKDAKKMLKTGLSIESISGYTKLSLKEINESSECESSEDEE